MESIQKTKCPKCGFPQPSSNVECVKCGVIFSKIRKEANAETLLMSTIPYEEKGLLYNILWPLAKAKKYCDLIYAKILSLIWDELFKGENEYGQAAHLIAFFIVSAVSLLLYHLEEYEDLLILGLLIIFCLDYYITSLKFQTNKINEKLSLVKKDKSLLELSRSGTSSEDTYHFDFKTTEIDHIILSSFDHVWGAFGHVVSRVWQIRLSLKNGVRMVIYENSDLNKTIIQGNSLARGLKVPFEVDHGGEASGLASKSLHNDSDEKELLHHGIAIRNDEGRIFIEKKIRLKSLLPVFGSIMELSGFFLFLLIMAGVLKRFGMILTFLIGPHIGLDVPYIYLDFSLQGILGIFKPELDWAAYLEYSIAIGMIFYRGRQLIRPVSVSIDRHELSVMVGSKKTGTLKTEDLAPPILLREPSPAIVLNDRNRVLKIENLFKEEERHSILREINSALSHFRVP